MSNYRVSDEIREAIIKDKKAGYSCNEIAAKYNVSSSYIGDLTMWEEEFRRQWANIYPGDEVRMQRKRESARSYLFGGI